MRASWMIALLTAAVASAQVVVPDGTKIRVRLDQMISSANAEQGQTVELSVTEAVKVGDSVVIQERRHMGRAGKLDFSIDRARATDGEWIPLRYTVNKRSGGGHAVSTGVLTAGAAVLFWPAAPAFLLIKGKDVTLNKGMIFDTFTDQDHSFDVAKLAPAHSGSVSPSAVSATASLPASGVGSVTITSERPGADIEIDGAFVGNTPTTLPIASGLHQIAVRSGSDSWQRNLQVIAGSTVNVNAPLRSQLTSTRLSR